MPRAGLGPLALCPQKGLGAAQGVPAQCRPGPSPPISMGPTCGWGQLRAPRDCHRDCHQGPGIGSWTELQPAPAWGFVQLAFGPPKALRVTCGCCYTKSPQS